MLFTAYDDVFANEAYDAVPSNDPVNEFAWIDPVNPYDPVSCLELVQTEPLFINKSPYDPAVVESITSCASPNSIPLSIRT